MSCSNPSIAVLSRSQSELLNKDQGTTLVETAGGDIHYVEKKISHGLDMINEAEPVNNNVTNGIKGENGVGRTSSLQRKPSLKKKVRTKSEGNLALQLVDDQMCLTQQLPLLGEPRYVYLDMKWTRFGFRLQSYGRQSELGRSGQTIVQSVTAGSPAFMAGLHAGDSILEVNGMDVRCSSADEIVAAILKTSEKRVQLLVKYVDGVRKMELRKKLRQLQATLAEKQKSLRNLLLTNQCLTSFPPIHKYRKSSNGDFPTFNYVFWTPPDSDSACNSVRSSMNEDQLNELSPSSISSVEDERPYNNIAVYTDDIALVTCDVLIIPFDHRANAESPIVIKLLQLGGDKLLNELALANQCPLGDVISTTAGQLERIRQIHHCVFGRGINEHHIKSVCLAALDKALRIDAATVVFWLEGFIDCLVPPTLLIETIKQVIDENIISFSRFGAIIFAAKCIPGLMELVTEIFS